MPNFDLVFPILLSILTLEQMTIKHSMYTQKAPLYYTERASVNISGFAIRHGGKVMLSKVLQVIRMRGCR